MKILFTRFPLESVKNGGAEKHTVTLMQALIKKGHEVVFAGSCDALIAMCRTHNIPVIVWDIGPPPVTKWHAISFLWRKRGMRTSLKELLGHVSKKDSKVDAIVMLSLSGKLLLTDVATAEGAQVFWIEHDRVGPWMRKNPWLKHLLHQSKHATTIVVSELSREIYKELGWPSNKLIAIPNGVEVENLNLEQKSELQEQNSKFKSQNSNLRIGCIARLSPEKGVDVLVAAIATLADVHLEIIGTGPDADRLRALARVSNVTDMITFTDHEEYIGDAYTRMDVLILPSREHDPFGLVAAEAMMTGIPVIVTDACGIAPYLTNGKDALVVPANSAGALRQAIEWMQNPENRRKIGAEGQKTAMEKFSVKKMVERYEDVFTGRCSS
jgi:glycosyltransferase involved in cell wall biosynthesis